MRIISDFKDYYDSIAKSGQDLSRIWIRKTKKHFVSEHLESDLFNQLSEYIPYKKLLYPYSKYNLELTDKNITKNLYHFWFNTVVVLIYGKAYPIILINHNNYEDLSSATSGLRKNLKNVSSITFPELFKKTKEKGYFLNKNNTVENKETWQEDFQIYQNKKVPVEIFLKFESPILMLWVKKEGIEVISNPDLSKLDFQKVKDPAIIWQELDFYMNNDMAVGDEYPPSPMTDKEKVLSHGFDPEYGFRKRKQ